jgi:hypothetical protein
MRNNLRRRYFTDRAIQGSVLLHVTGYWLVFLFAAAAFLLFSEMLSGDPRDAWQNLPRRYGPTALAVLVLGPIFLRDLCKLTNRFTGPMARLRRAMRDLAEGREVAPIHFRNGDFCQDLASDFNRVIERMQAARAGGPPADSLSGRNPPSDSTDLTPPDLVRL